MTDFVDLMRQPLARGSHSAWDDEQCIMERVSLLWAMHTGQDPAEVFSDLPECTNVVIARAAQTVNDALSDNDRQKLNGFLPRLLRARRTDADGRVNIRLALWAARQVLHLASGEDRQVCERAIQTVELWLADPCGAAYATAAAAIYASDAAVYANVAAYAAAAYANATTYADAVYANVDVYAEAAAAVYAEAATANDAELTLLAFLDELLNEWEEAVTKEGEDLYVPGSWQDEALAFVSEYMNSTEL